MKKKNNLYAFLGVLIVLLVGVIVFPSLSNEENSSEAVKIVSAKTVTVYKSPTCGCCVGYISMLKSKGYEVEVIETEDMQSVKNEHGVPSNMESCHTSIFDNYVVEGHVPFSAVEKLLEEKPDINGIALPNMPSGSPGMPGPKREPFTIYSLNDSGTDVFLVE